MKHKLTNTCPKHRTQARCATEHLVSLLMLYVVSAVFAMSLLLASGSSTREMDTFAIAPPTVSTEQAKFQGVLVDVLAGYPMQSMARHIAKQDPVTATFLISIAKQESNWGRYSPKDENGRDCYNYWGFRGKTERVTASGYSCFSSPREAVVAVGRRLNTLIWEYGRDTPAKLLVWKCGSSCASHDPDDVARWQRTVGTYAAKIEAIADVD